MGAGKSSPGAIDPTLSAELIDETPQCSVYRSRNGQEYQKYKVQNYGSNDFMSRYHYRIKSHHPNLVKAYYINQISNSLLCASSNIYEVVIQRIPYRLSDFFKLTKQQSINFLRGALYGFQQIYKTIGLILIKQSMIGINKQNHIKVWINPRFQLSNIEAQPASYENIPKGKKQSVMVQNLFQLIKGRTKKQSLWTRLQAQWQNNQPSSFQQAINLVQNFIVCNNISLSIVPNSKGESQRQDSFNVSSKRQSRSHTIQLQGVKQDTCQFDSLHEKTFTSTDFKMDNNLLTTNRYSHETQDADSMAKSSFAGIKARVINNVSNHNRVPFQNTPIKLTSSIQNQWKPSTYTPVNNLYQYSFPTNSSSYSNTIPTVKNQPINSQIQIPVKQFLLKNETMTPSGSSTPKVLITFGKPPGFSNLPQQRLSHSMQQLNLDKYKNIGKTQQNLMRQSYQADSAIGQQVAASPPTRNSITIGSQVRKMINNANKISKSQIRHYDLSKSNTKLQQNEPLSKSNVQNKAANEWACVQNSFKVTPQRAPGRIKHKQSNTLKQQKNSQIIQNQTKTNPVFANKNIQLFRNEQQYSQTVYKNEQETQMLNSRKRPAIVIHQVQQQQIHPHKLSLLNTNKKQNQQLHEKIQNGQNEKQIQESKSQQGMKRDRISYNSQQRQRQKSMQMQLSQHKHRHNRNTMPVDKFMELSKSRASQGSEMGQAISYRDLRNLLKSIQRTAK